MPCNDSTHVVRFCDIAKKKYMKSTVWLYLQIQLYFNTYITILIFNVLSTVIEKMLTFPRFMINT